MSNDRKLRESRIHDARFGTGDIARKQARKYYSIMDETKSCFRNLVLDRCNRKRLLEYGCGTGSNAVLWARSGANVTGIDISIEAIRQAGRQAEQNQVQVDFVKTDAEELGFPVGCFDLVVGTGILHHLDLQKSYAELARVLKPGGHAVFIEPLGHNPIINMYRRLTPGMRSQDEHPLRIDDIRLAGHYFGEVHTRFFNLTTLMATPLRRFRAFQPIVSVLRTCSRNTHLITFIISLPTPPKG